MAKGQMGTVRHVASQYGIMPRQIFAMHHAQEPPTFGNAGHTVVAARKNRAWIVRPAETDSKLLLYVKPSKVRGADLHALLAVEVYGPGADADFVAQLAQPQTALAWLQAASSRTKSPLTVEPYPGRTTAVCVREDGSSSVTEVDLLQPSARSPFAAVVKRHGIAAVKSVLPSVACMWAEALSDPAQAAGWIFRHFSARQYSVDMQRTEVLLSKHSASLALRPHGDRIAVDEISRSDDEPTADQMRALRAVVEAQPAVWPLLWERGASVQALSGMFAAELPTAGGRNVLGGARLDAAAAQALTRLLNREHPGCALLGFLTTGAPCYGLHEFCLPARFEETVYYGVTRAGSPSAPSYKVHRVIGYWNSSGDLTAFIPNERNASIDGARVVERLRAVDMQGMRV